MLAHLPSHLRPRREKIFGPAPSHPLDGNAKARVWAAAGAYNAAYRQPRQHWGPLTRATMDVLKAILWRFHGADGGGRCFPSFERIAAAAKCHRDTVCEAVKALEQAGLLTWVHRITRIRRRERDLWGAWVSAWQVQAVGTGSPLSSTERAAIETRMNKGIATRADREAWSRDLDARIALLMPMC